MTKRICLGKITSAHGVKGLVKIHPYGDDVILLETLSPLFTSETSNDQISVHIQSQAKSKVLCRLNDLTNRSDIVEYIRAELWIERDKRPDLRASNAYYYDDLIGLHVIDKTGKQTGKIISVQNFGAGDLLEIQTQTHGDIFIPFHDDFVRSIDLNTKTICADITAFL